MSIYTNSYLRQLQEISQSNEYFEQYASIIQQALLRAPNRKKAKLLVGYVEGHHILPKSFGLGGEKDPNNIAFLTGHEHLECHKLLVKFCQTNFYYKMLEALSYFANNTNRNLSFSSNDFALIQEANAIASSNRNKGNQYYQSRPNDSTETRALKSKAATNSRWVNNGIEEHFTQTHTNYILNFNFVYGRLPFSTEHWAALEAATEKKRGVPLTEEVKQNMRHPKHEGHGAAVSKGRKAMLAATGGMKKYPCNHCDRLFTKTNLGRWHNDNCKLKKPQ